MTMGGSPVTTSTPDPAIPASGSPRGGAQIPPGPPPTSEELQAIAQVLSVEMGTLMASLGGSWSISMSRVSILLAVLSAVVVALSFVAQGTGFGPEFVAFASILLPLLLFLGLATFARVVQGTREAVVYVLGMNRIRHFFAEAAPRSRAYLTLPIFDDESALARSAGGGMTRRPPRGRLRWALVQVPGVVAVIDAAVGGALAALVVAWTGQSIALVAVAAVTVFLVLLGLHLAYWERSVRELSSSLDARFPTPLDQADRRLGDPGTIGGG